MDKPQIGRIRKACGSALIAVKGEITVSRAKQLVDLGADILMVSEFITESEDINGVAISYLQELGIYEVDQFRIMTDF